MGPLASAATAAEALAVPGQIVLKAPAGTAKADVQALADKAGCRIVGEIPFSPDYYVLETGTRAQTPTRAASLPPSPAVREAVVKLSAAPGVLADPNYIYTASQTPPGTGTQVALPNDPLFPNQAWHMNLIRMPEAWAIQVGTRPVTVAVLDTGLDRTHPDFAGAKVLPGQNFADFGTVANTPIPNADVTDLAGHGTHVAGTITAATNNGVGVTSVAGWDRNGVDVRLLPVKVLIGNNNAPEPVGVLNVVIAGINYATAQNVNVVNMSLGGPGSAATLDAAIFQGQAKGIIYVAAAGNDASGDMYFPADTPGVIKVSAVGPDRVLAGYSNFNNIDLAAPGGDQVRFGDAGGVTSTSLAGSYRSFNGTSMAAPHVAGAVALLLAAGLPPGDVVPTLLATAQPVGDPVRYGAGLLDVYAALLVATGPTVRLIAPTNDATTLLRTLDVTLQLRNVSGLQPGDVTVQVRTISPNIGQPARILANRTSGGPGFNIPLPAVGTSTVAPIIVTLEDLPVEPGTLIVEVVLRRRGAGGTVTTFREQVFVNAATRRQAIGRTLFAVPYVLPLPQRPGATREQDLFEVGNTATDPFRFSLVRWDPIKSSQLKDFFYWFSATNEKAPEASFDPPSPGPGPLVYETGNPGVSIAPVGLGYWLQTSNDRDLNLVGTPITSPVAIRLFVGSGEITGWNLIGAPYTFPVDWNAVTIVQGSQTYSLQQAIDNNIIRSALVGYRQDYVFNIAPLGQLEPFNGYWVKVLQDCTLIIPPTPTSPQSVTRAPATTGKGWQVRFAAGVAGDRDGQNYFGQIEGAQVGEDRWDVSKPPSGAGHAYVRFLHKDSSGKAAGAYAFDMRPPSNGKEQWTAAVTTDRPNAEVTLSWDGLGSLPRRSRLTLADTATGQKVALRSRSSYTFRSGEAGSTRLFTIAVEPEASGGPLAITNLIVASGRAVHGVSVRFTLNQEAEVTGTVKTLGGKVVARLNGASRAAAASQTTLRWDGKGQDGNNIPTGPYVMELTARAADGQATMVKRPFMNLR